MTDEKWLEIQKTCDRKIPVPLTRLVHTPIQGVEVTTVTEMRYDCPNVCECKKTNCWKLADIV